MWYLHAFGIYFYSCSHCRFFFFHAIIHIGEAEIFCLNILQNKQIDAKQRHGRGSHTVNFRKGFSTEATPAYAYIEKKKLSNCWNLVAPRRNEDVIIGVDVCFLFLFFYSFRGGPHDCNSHVYKGS